MMRNDKPVKPVQRARRSTKQTTPIQAHPKLLAFIVTVGLVIFVAVCWITAQTYRRTQSVSSAWLLFAILTIVALLMAPLLYGPKVRMSLDGKGLRLGKGQSKSKTGQEDVTDLPSNS